MEDDLKLVELAKKGDHQAFELLVRKYKMKVYGAICSCLAGRTGAAEDIMQDVFVKAYKNLPFFRGRSSFGTWMYRIAVNQSRDYLRKKSRGDDRFIDGEAFRGDESGSRLDLLPSREPDIAQELTSREHVRLVKECLARLPEQFRTPLLLKEMEGLSYQEISETLGISIARVKIALFRARERMKEELRSLYPGGNFL